ncbi:MULTISPECIES: protein phosphatase 2C domain-containing protein [Streptomyces]|uniref:protein phosphatase 2C domain-containing protein n=1 Tax=Streptomyces TaxID=1883 RepID=UPI001C5733F5|nr:protein phosphatase 2C domain-containing protein [Streptomyces sp. 09ZI22]MBW3362000.1 protein phosphatase 2C domain-containing protein [Streptomyces sp. 09ZI22]
MSQQGEKPAAHEDDWWRKLYDETAPDTGPSSAPDSLDDRFDSVSDTVSTAVGHQRATGRETAAEDAYGGPDPVPVPVPVSAPEPRPEPPPLLQQDEELRAEPWEEPRAELKPEPEEPRAEPTPDPRSGWDLYRGPEPEPDPEPYGRSQPVPEPYGEPEPHPFTASAPAPAAVPGPRNTVFPAPWEAPAGPPGPRTFAVPKPPEPEPPPAPPASGTATVPDPGALHEPSPDWAASDAPADGGGARPLVDHLGDRPPTYDAEPAALPAATSENLDTLVPDTVLDGARYGTYTLRAASVRGDSARFRGEPRRDALLTTRFGAAESALVLVAVAGGVRAGEGAHLAAADACRWIGGAVARSHARLSEDIRAGRRADLKSGLHRLTDRTYGKLRARAAELGLEPGEYTTSLRCLLLSADPACRTRVFFGVGSGGLFRLRDGLWQDLEPTTPDLPSAGGGSEESADGDRLTMDLQITTPPSPYSDGPAPPPAEVFRFRASVARPGDTLLLCSNGLAEPMRGEPELPAELAERWGPPGPPGLPAFLADTQLRIKGYADDRTCAAVWEA